MARNNTHTFDGLVVGYGTHTVDNNILRVIEGGTVKTYVIEVTDATDIEDTDSITTASLPSQSVTIPRGSYIKSANFEVLTVFTSSNAAVLDIGTYEAGGDGSSTGDDDADGIDADIAITAIDAVGDVVACNGALVAGVVSCGAVSNSDVVVVFGWDAYAFTAGAGILTLEVVVPSGSAGRTVAN